MNTGEGETDMEDESKETKEKRRINTARGEGVPCDLPPDPDTGQPGSAFYDYVEKYPREAPPMD